MNIPVIILALDKRKELWLDLISQCQDRGFVVKPFIVGDGSDTSLKYDHIDKPGVPETWRWGTGISAQRHYWAFESHKAIIRYAVKKRLPRFLLMEDDAYFTERFDHVIENTGADMVIDCFALDLVYLGWWAFEHNNHMHAGHNLEIEENYKERNVCYLLNNVQCGGFHGVVINKTAYPTLSSLPPVAPMDSQCNSLPLNRSIMIPKVIHVKSTYSNCEDMFVQRDII